MGRTLPSSSRPKSSSSTTPPRKPASPRSPPHWAWVNSNSSIYLRCDAGSIRMGRSATDIYRYHRFFVRRLEGFLKNTQGPKKKSRIASEACFSWFWSISACVFHCSFTICSMIHEFSMNFLRACVAVHQRTSNRGRYGLAKWLREHPKEAAIVHRNSMLGSIDLALFSCLQCLMRVLRPRPSKYPLNVVFSPCVFRCVSYFITISLGHLDSLESRYS